MRTLISLLFIPLLVFWPGTAGAFKITGGKIVGVTILAGPVVPTSGALIRITWNDNSTDEDYFRIARNEDGGSFHQIAQVNPNTVLYDDTNIDTTTTYCYEVLAGNAAGGDSVYVGGSGSACAGPITAPPPILAIAANERTGTTAADSSGNGYTGTWNGWWSPAVTTSYGSALNFVSPSHKLTITGLTTHATKRSIAFWSRRTCSGGGTLGRLFDKRTGGAEVELMYYDSTAGTYRFIRTWSGNAGIWTVNAPSANVWHYISVVYDSSGTGPPDIYIDGVGQNVTTVSTPSGAPTNNSDPYVFGNRGAGDRNWAGELDEIRIYDYLLSGQGVIDAMNTPIQ